MATAVLSIVALVVLFIILIKVLPLRGVVVFEFQRGLKYRKGHFRGVLGPGRYWTFPPTRTITFVDVRPQHVTIPGQELISADGVTLKTSLAAEFEVADPDVAINRNASYQTAFYLVLQMELRRIVGGEKLDALLENRASLSARLAESTRDKVAALGLKLNAVDLKDLMIPGELRRTFAMLVKAQKEGMAALERARGETAALRNLANAAKMMEENPNLLQLRTLQVLADSTGNTIVFGIPGSTIPVTVRKNGRKPPEKAPE